MAKDLNNIKLALYLLFTSSPVFPPQQLSYRLQPLTITKEVSDISKSNKIARQKELPALQDAYTTSNKGENGQPYYKACPNEPT